MTKLISILCLFFAASLLIFMSPQVQFYRGSKSQRLYSLWDRDIEKLKSDKEFKKMFLNLNEVELTFTDPQVSNELDELKTPIKTTDGTSLKLKVAVIRWIDKNRYGYVLQHEVFDSNDDKIFEFGRTYKIGFIW